MDGQQTPGINYNSIDGLTTVNATTISINGSTINLASYIPYVGSVQAPDFNANQLKNIAIGTAGSDAAAFSQIPSITGLVPYTLAVSDVDLNGKQLKNIADGTLSNDAISLQQLTSYIPSSIVNGGVSILCGPANITNTTFFGTIQSILGNGGILTNYDTGFYQSITTSFPTSTRTWGINIASPNAIEFTHTATGGGVIGFFNFTRKVKVQPITNSTDVLTIANAAGTSIFSVDTLTSAISCNTVVNVNSNKIINLATATNAADAVRFDQLPTAIPVGTVQGSYIIHNGTTYINSADGTVNLGIYSNNNIGFNTNIGAYAGGTVSGQYRVNLGNSAGATTQSDYCTALGHEAGNSLQGLNATAVGNQAGRTSQGADSVAVGNGAAYSGQQSQCVSIGSSAGETTQGTGAIAIGYRAQRDNLVGGYGSVSIGSLAGSHDVGINCVAVGGYAGYQGQSSNSVAIGYQAGYSNQHLSSIIINATGLQLNSAVSSATYIAPIRTLIDGISSPQIYNRLAQYNTLSKELSVSATSIWNVIVLGQAPTDPSATLPLVYFMPTGVKVNTSSFTCTVVRISQGQYTLTFPSTASPNFGTYTTITIGTNTIAPYTYTYMAKWTATNTIQITSVLSLVAYADFIVGNDMSLRIEF